MDFIKIVQKMILLRFKSDKEVIEIKFSDGSKVNFGFNETSIKKIIYLKMDTQVLRL